MDSKGYPAHHVSFSDLDLDGVCKTDYLTEVSACTGELPYTSVQGTLWDLEPVLLELVKPQNVVSLLR